MKSLLVIGVAGAASLALGCGEVIEQPPAGVGGTSAGGSGGSGGGGGMAGSNMLMGGSGGSTAMAGSSSLPDAGAGGSGGFQYPANCPVPDPVGIPNQKIALQSFNFETSEVVLKNVSSTTQVIAGTREGWQWCSFPAYWNIAPQGNVTLAPGATYKFELIYNTQGVWPLLPEGGELGIYIESGTFDEPNKLVSFVSWGEGLGFTGRESVAVQADLWTLGQRVIIGNRAGFIATGSVNDESGYEPVSARCLVAPPNGE
ncbi:MAG: hypothetical protein RL685_5636 [Pseudomonadota bacterium]|jgi:hypothetical protein